MVINSLLNNKYFKNTEIKEICNYSKSEIIEIFEKESDYVIAIDEGEVEYVYIYNIIHSETLLIKWFYKNILEVDIHNIDLNKFKFNKVIVQSPQSKLNGDKDSKHNKIETSYLSYNLPLCYLEIFLNESSDQTKQVFNFEPLYIHSEGITKKDPETIDFNDEKFFENYSNTELSIKESFAEDLFNFIQSHYKKQII